jgi:hypothetical protein
MKTTLALLAATTAFGALFAFTTFDGAHAGHRATLTDATQEAWVSLVSGDEDYDDGEDEDEDEDEDCEEGDDDEEEEEEACIPTQPLPPAGTIAPPANGLFGTGAPPKVQVN